jgi:hypothetical protein
VSGGPPGAVRRGNSLSLIFVKSHLKCPTRYTSVIRREMVNRLREEVKNMGVGLLTFMTAKEFEQELLRLPPERE